MNIVVYPPCLGGAGNPVFICSLKARESIFFDTSFLAQLAWRMVMKKWEIIAVVGTFVVVIAVALVTLLPNCQWESPSVSHKLCVNKVKPNLALKRHTGSIDLSRWIGYRADNSCVVPDPAMLDSLGLRVTNFVQYEGPGTCTDMTDTNCPIVANGLTVSVKGTDYAASEVRKFDVTIQDARGDQVHVFLVTQSGQIFRSGDQNSKIIRTLK